MSALVRAGLASGPEWWHSPGHVETESEPSLPPLFSPVEILRAAVRAALLGATVFLACVEYWLFVRNAVGSRARAQAEWLHRAAQRVIRLLSVRVERIGIPPSRGIVVANHLSYLDIILLSAIAPFAFISKAEVADWPVFGFCAKCGGTIFIDRQRRGDIIPVSSQVQDVVTAGVPVVFFPEGTSSSGDTVLPFKPALFSAAVQADAPTTAVAIDYALPAGSVADDVAYWGDDDFLHHLFNLLGKVDLRARVAFGEPMRRTGDRKELARKLHDEVSALRAPGERQTS